VSSVVAMRGLRAVFGGVYALDVSLCVENRITDEYICWGQSERVFNIKGSREI